MIVSGWKWGEELSPSPSLSLWDTLPRIQGQPVILVSDIRTAPGGDKWSYRDDRIIGSELQIKIRAVVTDRFTLYLEAEPSKRDSPFFVSGIQLDSSGRKDGVELTTHVVRFQLPFEERIITRPVPLFSATECRLIVSPQPLPTSLIAVEECPKKEDLTYSVFSGWVKDEKLQFDVQYPFSVVEFKLLHEDKAKSDEYGQTILNAELLAIEDHKSSGCSCERKGKSSSIIEFELSQLGFEKPDVIILWGGDPGSWFSQELYISTKNVKSQPLVDQ